jgi:hypothetical protein
MTDEHHDRAVGFSHRNRMTLAVIDAGGRDFGGVRDAGAERGRKTEQGAKRPQRLDAMERNSGCHRSVLVPTR